MATPNCAFSPAASSLHIVEKSGTNLLSSSLSPNHRQSELIRPVDWPSWAKHIALFQLVSHAGMTSWCASAFVPALAEMSETLGQSMDEMTYLIGAYTLMLGFGVLLWNPLADKIGRRSVLLISMSIAIAATCGTAIATTYSTMIVARIFQGFGICAPASLGAAYIKDMYQAKHRGTALGVWTLSITAGPFIAPFISGFIANRMHYAWIIWFEALLLSFLFIVELLFLPESLLWAPGYRNVSRFKDIVFQSPRLFSRSSKESFTLFALTNEKYSSGSYNSLKETFVAAGYYSVWLCGLGFAVPFGYISVGISSLFPRVYGIIYDFNPPTQGLLYLPMLVGSILAEMITGRAGDWVVTNPQRIFVTRLIARRNGEGLYAEVNERVPEVRLVIGLCGIFLSIGGLVWFGSSVERHLHWANPAVATGLAAFGVQMLTSVCFSYIIDCHQENATEIATVMNLFRVLSSFVVLFYNNKLDTALGYAWSFGTQAIISGAFGFGGLGLLVLFGRRLRQVR